MNHFPLAAIRYGIAALAVTATMLSGCTGSDTDDGVTPPAGEKITITASTERRTLASGEVRTSLAANDEVLWSMDDTFVVYDLSTYDSSTFEIKSGAGTASGVFTGYKPQGTSYIALYGDNSYGGGILTLPAEQTYDASGFAPYMNPMAAVTSDLESGLSFKNLMGILELNVTGTKTVESVTVSCDGMMLSGTVSVSPTTLDIVSHGTPSSSVSLVGINEILDPVTARKFNVVVPPGTYENLKIRIINTDGTSVLRTAGSPIEVGRNQIVPIMGLEDGDEAQESVVKLFIDQERSSWHMAVVCSQMSSDCSKFVYMFGTDAFVAEWKANNPGGTDRDMVLANGAVYTEDIEYFYDDYPGTTYNFYALGYDADGAEDQLVHVTYTMEIPYDDTMSLAASVADEDIAETTADITLTPSGPVAKIYMSVYQKTDFGSSGPDMNQMFYSTREYPTFTIDVSGGAVVQELGNLLPDRAYLVFYIGESAEGRFTPIQTLEFATKAYTTGNAAVTITGNVIEDIKASFNIEMNESAVSYKALTITKSTYDYYMSEGLNLGDEVAAITQPAVSDKEYVVADLAPETDYVVVAVAYDAEGVYGDLCEFHFATTPYIPVQDPNYDLLLGNWSVSYVDYQTNEPVKNGFTVTVQPDVEGKTFTVYGLMASNPNIVMPARFVNNGICLDAGTLIAQTATDNVYFCLVSGGYLLRSGYYFGTLAGDHITFEGRNVPYEVDGCMFFAFNAETDDYAGYYDPGMMRLEFDRVQASSAGSSTQRFDRVNPVTPSWR